MNLGYGQPIGGQPRDATDITVPEDLRVRSQYVLGQSGSGKTSLLRTQLAQDVRSGTGFCVLDVEETLGLDALRYLAESRDAPEGVVVIDPTRTAAAVPLNALRPQPGVHPHTCVEQVVFAMRRAWADSWGPRLDDLLRHSLALLQEHGLTLAELPRLLSDKRFREHLALESKDQRVRLYFLHHLGNVPEREWRVWIEAARNKASAFANNPFIEPFVACEDCLDFRSLMDRGARIIVNIPDRVLGESAQLFGMLVVGMLYTAARQRAEGSRPFIVYADEFQSVASRAFLDLITRTRKRGVGVICAHQNLKQPPFDRDEGYLSTLLGNAATQVFMQMGHEDAERIVPEVFPITGTTVKRRPKHWLWGDYGEPKFYSVSEEREHYASELEHQRPRECFVKVKQDTGTVVYAATTYDVPRTTATDEDVETLVEMSLSEHGTPARIVRAAQTSRLARVEPQAATSGQRSKRRANRGAEFPGDVG